MVNRRTARMIQRLFYVAALVMIVLLCIKLKNLSSRRSSGGGSRSGQELTRGGDIDPPNQPFHALQTGSNTRSEAVKRAFTHSFVNGYMRHAFPSDELRPVSNVTNDSWGAMGVTVFDALDTAVVMGVHPGLIEQLIRHVTSVDFARSGWKASLFEASIRYLGGLQGAHALTGDPRLLDAIARLKSTMRPAFAGQHQRQASLPQGIIDFSTGVTSGAGWLHGQVVLSECCSIQLEWGDESMYVFDILKNAGSSLDGLYPALLNQDGTKAKDLYTFGGLGDSFYEVLLKLWILRGKPADDLVHGMYRASVEGLRKHLVAETADGHVFVGELEGGVLLKEMDHLLCMLPGVLALGEMHDPEHSRGADLQLAEQLLGTCRKLYRSTASGFGPERAGFEPGREFSSVKSSYLLRPEYIESLFVLYRVTRNEKYRDWAWEVYLSIEKFCRTPLSFSGLSNVDDTSSQNDSVQSFFFAETLKYLYLIFHDADFLPLDQYVFTTEAHPLKI